MSLELTVKSLEDAKFRGPVAFYDGKNGMARQDFECVEEPRFGYFWRRENRNDRGRQSYMVDGAEVRNLAEACEKLGLPPDPDSPRETRARERAEFMASPKLIGQATRAQNEAECNASAGVFGQVRAFMQRAGNAWHQGVNAYSDLERAEGREHPHWPYNAMSAAHESYRGVYLFEQDGKQDSDLRCARGVRCRDCPILVAIEKRMLASRSSREGGPFPSAVEDGDIVGAKVWTCIAHVLSEGDKYLLDGMVFSTQDSR